MEWDGVVEIGWDGWCNGRREGGVVAPNSKCSSAMPLSSNCLTIYDGVGRVGPGFV